MADLLVLVFAATGTAFATGWGAVPVFVLGSRAKGWQPGLLGMAAGTMSVAAVAGLLIPGLDSGVRDTLLGVALGIAFLVAGRMLLGGSDPHIGRLQGASVRSAVLVFGVLFVHSFPEGFAIGTGYASDIQGLSLFIILAIALQNVPEGTAVAIPMADAGFSPARQFWAAVGTSVPQPIAAIAAFLAVDHVKGLLPVSFGFAAGAMLALVATELAPRLVQEGRWSGLIGAAGGGGVMLALTVLLGVD